MISLFFGNCFDSCLKNLGKVLQKCEETNLVLNWEKCHFMVNEGNVLGHKVSQDGLEVDKAKLETIEKLPPPSSVKGLEVFLSMQDSIKDLLKISPRLLSLFAIYLKRTGCFALMRTI